MELEASTILGQLWHGLYCIEKSEIEAEQTFPMSAQGLADIRTWLESHQEVTER